MIDPEHFFEPPNELFWSGVLLYLAGLVTGTVIGATALYCYIFKR